MARRISARSVAGLALSLGLAAAHGPGSARGWVDLPREPWRGCEQAVAAAALPERVEEAGSAAAAPRDRVELQTRQRRLAAITVDEAEVSPEREAVDACWRRLDGIWRADDVTRLDMAIDAGDWGADNPALEALAHGNYTRARHLVIAAPGGGEDALIVSDAFDPDLAVRFEAADALLLDRVLVRGGERKRYVAAAPGNPLGRELFVDVTRSGLVRISIGSHQFYRPRSSVAKSGQDLAASDAFLISYNLENLAASRRGYDIIEQDAFFFLNNPKQDVFAQVDPRRYSVDEKRIVPVGFTLVQEAAQGMVYRRALETTEESVQTTLASAFGANVTLGDDTVRAGYATAKEEARALSSGRTVARATAYSRAKLYALLVDHPYIVLSDAFVTAIEDARRRGDSDPGLYRRIVERFGTHYPYAVTYGAAARVTRTLDEESFLETFGSSSRSDVMAGAKLFGVDGEFSLSRMRGRTTSSAGSFVREGASFVGVGGNGSWDENGFAPGQTPYPILLDLRPLHELLSPMTFPGEPEVYGRVRDRLEQEIIRYIESRSGSLSSDPFRPLPRGIEGDYRLLGGSAVNRFWPLEGGAFEVARLTGGNPGERFVYRRTGQAHVYRRQGQASTYTHDPRGDAFVFRGADGTPIYLTRVADRGDPSCATLLDPALGSGAMVGTRALGVYSESGRYEADLVREFRTVGAESEWLQYRFRRGSGPWTAWSDWEEVTPGAYMPPGGSRVFTIRDGGETIVWTAPGTAKPSLVLRRVADVPANCAP